MSKKSFIARASVITFVMLGMFFLKPTDVEAHDSGCDIVSPSTMVNRFADEPINSTEGTWQSWIDWYATKGYTYTGYSDASGAVTAYWMNLQKGSELYYAFLYKHPALDRYWSPYKQWIKVDGAYYYTNELGIVYRNTWVWTRTNNESAAASDLHGYFVFDNSGKMCTGWHKGSDNKWYYMRIDHTNNTDGPSMKVGVDSGFLWETVRDSVNTGSMNTEGLYYFTGINVNTNVYIEDTSGNYGSAKTSTVKYSVGDGTGQVKPLATKTISADTAYVNRQYNSSYFYINTSHAGSYTGSYNFTISNGDYKSYIVNNFNYYIARNTYTMTLNHKKYNVSTGKYDDWKSETAEAKYGTTYTPAYTTAPTGYFKQSRDCNSGWTVTGNKTFSLYYYPNSYTQSINFYKYTASGTYTGPTHKNELLGAKTYSALYGTTFNAKSYKNAWGDVTGYHWSSIDTESWTVTKAASTNSYYSANKYRLNVDLNKGSGSTTPSGTSGNFDMEYGTYKDLGSPTRVGYIFNNWKITSNNSTNSSLSNNKFTMGYNNTYPYKDYKDAASVKIAAQWTPITYTVRFNGNGNWNTSQGSYTQQFTYDVSAALLANEFTRPDKFTYNGDYYERGYEFIGWGTSPNQTKPSYTNKQAVVNLTATDGGVIDLYALWKKDITLTFNFNGGKFNNNSAPEVLEYSMYNSELNHTFDIAQYYGTLTGTDYNSKGLNNNLTKTDSNGIQYRFLGYSLNPDATEPDSNFDVYAKDTRIENYTIRDNTTLYAVWEPVLQMTVQLSVPSNPGTIVLTEDVPVTTALGNFKILSGTKNTDLLSSGTASVNSATIGANVTNAASVNYTVSAKGASSIKFSTAADSRILDIYNHGKNNPWFDNLNEVKDFNYSIDDFTSKTSSFTIPQYLGTTQSYQTSNPDLASGTTVYAIKFTCTQPSYYYSKYWHSDESTSVYCILFLKATDSSGTTGGTTGSGTGGSTGGTTGGINLPPYAVEDGMYDFQTILN